MHKHKSLIITIIGTIIVVVGLSVALAMTRDTRTAGGSSKELLALATCLADKGAIFYGAFWCPHCQEQKGDFGDAVDALPYVECATLGGAGQTEACKNANITSYPTWEFPGGERKTGRIPLAELALKTGCPAPTTATIPAASSAETIPAIPPVATEESSTTIPVPDPEQAFTTSDLPANTQ